MSPDVLGGTGGYRSAVRATLMYGAGDVRIETVADAHLVAERARGGPATRYIDRAKELQDVLGEYQDAIVAENELRKLAQLADHSGAALLAGRIIERQQARRLHARKAFPKTWKRLRRAGKRAW